MSELEITPNWLKESIIYEWRTNKAHREYNSTDLTHLIFEDLYRIIRKNKSLLKVTYETLAKLNEEDGNTDMMTKLLKRRDEFETGSWG